MDFLLRAEQTNLLWFPYNKYPSVPFSRRGQTAGVLGFMLLFAYPWVMQPCLCCGLGKQWWDLLQSSKVKILRSRAVFLLTDKSKCWPGCFSSGMSMHLNDSLMAWPKQHDLHSRGLPLHCLEMNQLDMVQLSEPAKMRSLNKFVATHIWWPLSQSMFLHQWRNYSSQSDLIRFQKSEGRYGKQKGDLSLAAMNWIK